MIGRLLTALLIGAASLSAQTVKTHLNGVPVTALVVPAPAIAESLWAYVQTCSRFPAIPGELAHVVWLRAPLLRQIPLALALGVWHPPDTVVLDEIVITPDGVVTDTLEDVVAHELLHQLLRGPVGMDPHPPFPFIEPCWLMYPQRHNDATTKRRIERQRLVP
jgi:hypothetical protein